MQDQSLSTIKKETSIEGHLRGEGALLVEGKFMGSIDLQGEVKTSASSLIEGSVQAERLLVNGRIVGEVKAKEGLHIGPTAELEGEIHAEQLEIHPSAKIKSRIHMSLDLPRQIGSSPGSSPWAR